MSVYLGDYPASATVDFKWDSNAVAGESITRGTDGSLRIYKDNSDTQRASSAGITDTEDFDGLTGVHHARIDLSDNTTAGFYAAAHEYTVVLQGAVIDGKTINATLAHFSIERSGGVLALLKAVIAGTSTVAADVTKLSGDSTAADNAEAFFDGTGYAGTNNTIPTVTTVTNAVSADVTKISGDTTAADNAEAFFDGTGYAGTNNVIPTVTTVTNAVSADVTKISGDTTAADNAEAFFDGTGYAGTNNTIPTVTTVTNKTGYELSTGGVDAIWDEAQSGHVTAGTFGKYLDTEVSTGAGTGPSAASIADAVWDEAQSGHTSGGTFGKYLDVEISTLNTKLDTIDDFVDTEVAAIKLKTDNLPSDPADASDIATAFTGVNTKLDTIQLVTDGLTLTGGNIDANIKAYNDVAIESATVVSDIGNNALTFKTDRTETATDFWKDAFFRFNSGDLAGQCHRIANYNGSTKFLTMAAAFSATPDPADVGEFINR